MSLPLEGIRVVDLTRMFAGPCATEVLSDLGADVVKVEEPRVGDPTRRNLPFWGGESAYYMSLNRGKRSVTLDLKDRAGKKAALDLIATADVVVENYRPGVMDRLGLGWKDLSALHPRVVLCSLSGFGATGPLRDKISFDLVNQAMAGMIDLTGDPDDRPVRIGVPVGDMAGGLYLAIATLAALRARNETGLGSWVDLSLHDVLISLLSDVAQRHFVTGEDLTRTGSRHRDLAPQGCYRAGDGWLVLSALTHEHWVALAEVLAAPQLRDEARFADARARKSHEDVLDQALAERLQRQPVARWVEALTARGVPAAAVTSLDSALESAVLAENGIIFTAEHPTVGTMCNLASPLVIDSQRAGAGGTSPVLGADTVDVLREVGYSENDLVRLADDGVIRNDVADATGR
jgi:crotonobetainyl-CoA:carnitine CoA-transferase CaiB-like acyl-CoA transferase